MGIFDTYSNAKYGRQRISERFLRKMGFKKHDNWGSPGRWNHPGSVFWEKPVIEEDELYKRCVATIWYFPPEFTGYVTHFGLKGEPSHDKVLVLMDYGDDYMGDALCKNDIQYTIDLVNEKINDIYKLG